ncbi:MAG: glycine zipper 2TM domain-containing protein [Aquificaceae bacterium]|nr:glycine zipper 2TM domain-containing protein [Aquificaceae bacterium]MCX7989755.1 glycine zipper 2TM domain-containing protein [Aquificaceae bacterium]MDW8032959.1 glycine zipper 2TM domain-containing protein [Aquificaceae bacterium]MDW8294196.1 glycine zipper 2TM domain-containing protein [Aquificaceae bacterium]
MRRKAFLLFTVFGAGIIFSCGQVTTQRTYEGATVGAIGGAIAGALIDRDNRWRGAVIGGALGAVIGGTITEIASRASREAAVQNRPVQYESVDKREKVLAEPVATRGNCRLVKTTYYQDGKVVKVEEKEVCP